jgi:hypothetical protein
LRAAGCELVTEVAAQWEHRADPAYLNQRGTIRFHDGVAMFFDLRDRLCHTHSPLPMLAILADLAATGRDRPDLVVADHGWAGAAGQSGVDAVGLRRLQRPGAVRRGGRGPPAGDRSARRRGAARPVRADDRVSVGSAPDSTLPPHNAVART